EEAANVVRSTRPTAVNLFHAVDRVLSAARKCDNAEDAKVRVFEEAQRIADEDVEACRKIGECGGELIEDGDVVLTHCNAGALAFVDFGTALAPIRIAHYSGKKVVVFVDETRPRLQGARLTAWELKMEGIEHYVIADNAAGYFMRKGVIKKVIVGADRIAANGDVANKIGTYKLALAAKANGTPFYVAAPTSTFDLNCPSGDKIPIEERGENEVIYVWGVTDRGEWVKVRIVPEDCKARNPAFDVTPNELISAIITEKGVLYPPFSDSIRKML
ncbi:MAG: S-methyl-5-thioribose-1-phosphate isomerase, partial [Candidatus Baldrarchaeia archaeon]